MDGYSFVLFVIFLVGVVFALAAVYKSADDSDEYPTKDEWRHM